MTGVSRWLGGLIRSTHARACPPARSDSGIAATTVAILFPAVLVLVFIVIQAGIYYHTQQWAAAAADRAVARASQVGAVAADGQVEGQQFLAGSICGSPAVQPVLPPPTPDTVRFTVSCEVDGPLAALVPDVSASSTAPIERFIPETERS